MSEFGLPCDTSGRRSWPELVGKNGEAAANIIMKENPKLQAIVIGEGDGFTMDYVCDRVLVLVDKCGIVNQTPMLGVGKISWPELVGVNGDMAAEVIMKEEPTVEAMLVPDWSLESVIMDYNCNRVWVYVNHCGLVKRTPKIGGDRSSWPELVGMNGEAAAEWIRSKNKGLLVVVTKEGDYVITDYLCDRVWVWVDKCGIVIKTPTIG